MSVNNSFSPVNTEVAFLPTATVYPEENVGYALEQNYQRTAQAVNVREVAFYLTTEETLTGQVWEQTDPSLIGIPYSTRSPYRKVVAIPALAAGLNVIPHGIAGIGASYMFVKVTGGIGNGALWAPVPNSNILVEIDAVNVNITIPPAYVAFEGYVSLEYLKDN